MRSLVNEIKSGRYKNLMTKFMLHIKMKFYIQTASTLDLHYCHFHQSISIANEDFFMNSKFSSIKSHDVMFCTKYLIQVFFLHHHLHFPFTSSHTFFISSSAATTFCLKFLNQTSIFQVMRLFCYSQSLGPAFLWWFELFIG